MGVNSKRRSARCALAGVLLWSSLSVAAPPSDTEIRETLRQRVDEQRRSVGIVVGIYENGKTRVVSYGRMAQGDARPLNGNTVFEIGSITKVFTAVALADSVKRGEVKLEEPIGKYLPAGLKVSRRAANITFLDLATHTSGLPSLPPDYIPMDPANPYFGFTTEMMYDLFSTYAFTAGAAGRYQYSNMGFGLLGDLLATRAGTDYESLVAQRISEPLKLTSTAITLTPDLQSRLATGHDGDLNATANWDISGIPGAGALHSTANDLLKFVAAMIDSPSSDRQTALGWDVVKRNNRDIISKGGATGGYRSFVGFDREKRTGVIVLANASKQPGVDDLGLHLIDATFPLTPAPPQIPAITLEPAVLERYVGAYELRKAQGMTVIRDGKRLFAQLEGQPRAEIFATAPGQFFYKVVDARISFEAEGDGRATGLVLSQGGADFHGTRIAVEQARQSRQALQKRIQAQVPAPTSEKALRRQLEGFMRGRPYYEDMAQELAAATRQQWDKLQKDFAQAGALRSVRFKRVRQLGLDAYDVIFEKLRLECALLSAADGKLVNFGCRPLEPDSLPPEGLR